MDHPIASRAVAEVVRRIRAHAGCRRHSRAETPCGSRRAHSPAHADGGTHRGYSHSVAGGSGYRAPRPRCHRESPGAQSHAVHPAVHPIHPVHSPHAAAGEAHTGPLQRSRIQASPKPTSVQPNASFSSHTSFRLWALPASGTVYPAQQERRTGEKTHTASKCCHEGCGF